MYKLRNIFIFSCVLLVAPLLTYAQAVGSAPDPVQYIVAPQTPGPNTNVAIQVQGTGTFLGDSTVTWSENGKIVSSGTGDSAFNFTTGPLGTETVIHVDINSSQEGDITHTFTFIPSIIDLVWEADTTAPPLFKGKSLYSAGSTLRVVAFPTILANGGHLPASSLSYQWAVNSTPDPSGSGLGKSSYTFIGDQLQPQEDVTVDVYYGANDVGRGEVVIPNSTPELVLYDQDPLRGTLYDEALPGTISLDTKQLTVDAVPYYFSNASVADGGLEYAWTLNGSTITGPESAKGVLTLVQTGSGTGAADLSVTLQDNDTDKLVQAAQATLQLVFGQSTGSNLSSFFGL
jgi:hypothetical protein